MKDETDRRLNCPANRDLADSPEMIKSGLKSLTPGIGQMCPDLPEQSRKPVTLSGSLDTTDPPAAASLGYDAGSNRDNRSLKSPKITFGPQPYHTSAIRTPVSLQRK